MVKFLKKVLFQYQNFEMNLHQLVKKFAKGPTINGQNKTTKMYNLQPLKKNPDSSFCMVISVFEDFDKQSH